ncbi:MAG: hypothetical protein ACKVQC_06600, partial [Elusimicrobiota bacterium]
MKPHSWISYFRGFLFKSMAVLLSMSIFFTQALFAHSVEKSIWEERRKNTRPKDRIINPSHAPLTSKVDVIFLQDIHGHTEAQLFIADTLRRFLHPAKPHEFVVAVEGADGFFNFSPFRWTPNMSVTKKLAKQFLNNKYISGVSYAGLTLPAPLPVFKGVDDALAYRKNVEAYLQSVSNREKVSEEIKTARAQLDHHLLATENATLLKALFLRSDYSMGKNKLEQYMSELSQIGKKVALAPGDQLTQFLALCEEERALQFEIIEKEKKILMTRLMEKLDETGQHDLFSLTEALKNKKIVTADFYKILTELLSKNNINLSHSPRFNSYLAYVQKSKELNMTDILNAVDQFEERVILALAKNEQENKWAVEDKSLILSEKLHNYSLTPSEWARYKTLKPVSGNLPSLLSSFELFYSYVDIRSQKMAERVLALNRDGVRVILVAGGFHTEEVLLKLKKSGLSAMVIKPQVSSLESGSTLDYLSTFSREHTPIEKMVSGEKISLVNENELIGAPTVHRVDIAFKAALIKELGGTVKPLSRLTRVLRFLKYLKRLGIKKIPLSHPIDTLDLGVRDFGAEKLDGKPENKGTVSGFVMPLLEEALRFVAILSFGLPGAFGYIFIHALLHFWIDVYGARDEDRVTRARFLKHRLFVRMVYS